MTSQASLSIESPSEENESMSDDSSFSSYSSSSSISPKSFDSDMISVGSGDYSLDLRRLKKRKRHKLRHIMDDCLSHDSGSMDSIRTEEDMIDHAAKCDSCKMKMMKILQGAHHNSIQNMPNPSYASPPTKISTDTDISKDTNRSSHIKEFVIIFAIGLLIIFLMDFTVRATR